MLTISRGNQTLTVTKGAYKSIYAPQGWEITPRKIANEKDDFMADSENGIVSLKTTEDENLAGKNDEIEDDIQDIEEEIDFSEIPLSEMSVPQLKLYAKQLGIDVNTDSARQLRSQIRKATGG